MWTVVQRCTGIHGLEFPVLGFEFSFFCPWFRRLLYWYRFSIHLQVASYHTIRETVKLLQRDTQTEPAARASLRDGYSDSELYLCITDANETQVSLVCCQWKIDTLATHCVYWTMHFQPFFWIYGPVGHLEGP